MRYKAALTARLLQGLQSAAAEAAARARAAAPCDTGRLRQSIACTCMQEGGVITAFVTAEAPYAAAVELGTSRCPPRPYLRPAAQCAWRALRIE